MQQIMKSGPRQLDGGQRDGYYNEYQIMLKDANGAHSALAYVYATASTMGKAPPMIWGVPMAPETEYWVFNDKAASKLSTATRIDITYAGSRNASISPGGSGWVAFTATEEAGWSGVEAMTFPAAAAVFGADQGIVRGIGFQIDGAAIQRVWWCQTGQSNLTPDELSSVQLLADAYGTSAGEYVASSRLVPLQA